MWRGRRHSYMFSQISRIGITEMIATESIVFKLAYGL